MFFFHSNVVFAGNEGFSWSVNAHESLKKGKKAYYFMWLCFKQSCISLSSVCCKVTERQLKWQNLHTSPMFSFGIFINLHVPVWHQKHPFVVTACAEIQEAVWLAIRNETESFWPGKNKKRLTIFVNFPPFGLVEGLILLNRNQLVSLEPTEHSI